MNLGKGDRIIMGTDSTELTFIRCPSCKSLVPAASPRCRMCGSALEAGKKSADSEDAGQKKNNFQRARQHTINVNSEERARLEEESESKQVASKPEPVEIVQSEPEFDIDGTDLGDPLGAFLEEVAVESEQRFKPEVTEDPEEDFGTENGFHVDAEEPAPEIQKVKKTFVQNRDLGSTMRARQPGKGGLSFSKPKKAEPEEIFPEEPVFAAVEQNDFLNEEEAPAYVEPEVFTPPPVRQEVRAVAPRAPEPKPVERDEVNGKLIGWMVSYKDPKGTAIELREGKFFLSRSSLKGSDLIIDDSSISTPHALFGISSAQGVKLQDLMSERGVFVRKKGSDAYQRMLESIKLEHGDWVRFGDVEFQIAIL